MEWGDLVWMGGYDGGSFPWIPFLLYVTRKKRFLLHRLWRESFIFGGII